MKSTRRNCLKAGITAAGMLSAGRVFGQSAGAVTVTGTVCDTNNRPLPNVMVSDSVSVVLTDAAGKYQLTVSRDRTRFVYVILPRGYRGTEKYSTVFPCEPIPRTGTAAVLNFELCPWAASNKAEFTVAHFTDIHLLNSTVTAFKQLLTDIADAPIRPDFVLDTGDCFNDNPWVIGSVYADALKQLGDVPYFSTIGNHDITGARDAGTPAPGYDDYLQGGYEYHLGPAQYAFHFSDFLFIITPFLDQSGGRYTTAYVKTWFDNLLPLISKGTKLILCTHSPVRPALVDDAQQYGHTVEASFTGHYHSRQMYYIDDMVNINSPRALNSGDDGSPNALAWITACGGKITDVEYRLSTVKKSVGIVLPENDAQYRPGALDFSVAVYDAFDPPVQVRGRIDSGAWFSLTHQDGWMWNAKSSVSADGQHTAEIEVEWTSGVPATRSKRSFRVSSKALEIPLVQSAGDWPQFQRNAQHSGAGDLIAADGFRLAWSTPLNRCVNVASPVVENGMLFMAVDADGRAGESGVIALDATTGRILWHYKTRSAVKCSAAVKDGMVYISTMQGMVIAINALTGGKIWEYDFELNRTSRAAWNYAAPVVSDDIVYTGPGDKFTALNRFTGVEIWETFTNAGSKPKGCYMHPAIGSDLVYLSIPYQYGLIALDRVSGEKIWENKKNHASSAPVVDGTALYYPHERSLACLDAATGDVRWLKPLSASGASWGLSSPAVSDKKLFIGTPDGKILCLDKNTGEAQWTFSGAGTAPIFLGGRGRAPAIAGSPVIAGETLYFGAPSGRFIALDFNTGTEQWSYDLRTPIGSSAAVSGNAIFITGIDGTVNAFAAPVPSGLKFLLRGS
ncbi:MAG: PQQ-binding-like beta-propeller repeat protein [Kiritimatiellales bacterium]